MWQLFPQSILENAAPELHQTTLEQKISIVQCCQIRPNSNILLIHIIIVEKKEALSRWKSPWNHSVKHSGELLMLWGHFVACDVGAFVKINAIMNSANYLDISAQNLFASNKRFRVVQIYIFWQEDKPI